MFPAREIDIYSTNMKDSNQMPLQFDKRDIFCDDGCRSIHDSNLQLIMIVSLNCREYLEAETISKKREIAASVVDSLSSPKSSVRFLKKNEGNSWVVAEREEAIRWTVKAFDSILSGKMSVNANEQRQKTFTSPIDDDSVNDDFPMEKLLLKQHQIFTMLSGCNKGKPEATAAWTVTELVKSTTSEEEGCSFLSSQS